MKIIIQDNTSYIYNEETDPEMSAAEKEYYDKILETISDFQEKYGVTIDKYYLHGAVSYRYFTTSLDDLFSSDSGVTDSELEDAIGNLDSSSTEDPIDYTEATKKIGVVASLMNSKECRWVVILLILSQKEFFILI